MTKRDFLIQLFFTTLSIYSIGLCVGFTITSAISGLFLGFILSMLASILWTLNNNKTELKAIKNELLTLKNKIINEIENRK